MDFQQIKTFGGALAPPPPTPVICDTQVLTKLYIFFCNTLCLPLPHIYHNSPHWQHHCTQHRPTAKLNTTLLFYLKWTGNTTEHL